MPLVYFFPATSGRLIISPDDGVIFNIPIRVAVANLIRGGHLPLWNPYIFSGMPLFGAAQAGVLFPLNWFYLAFSPAVATNLMMLSTYMLAALGAYLYARRSGQGEVGVGGAALTSIVWQCSGFLVGQIGHTNILHTAALLPWLLWAIDGYGSTGKRSRGLLLAVLVAVQVFAGHQQTFAYALLVAAAYAVVRWRVSNPSSPIDQASSSDLFHSSRLGTKNDQSPLSLWERVRGEGLDAPKPSPSGGGRNKARDEKRFTSPFVQSHSSNALRHAYLRSLVFIGAGLGLAAVQILPTLELLRHSLRADASYDFFTSFSMPRRFIWTFFAPYLMGGGDGNLFRAPYVGPAFYAEYVGYVGVATIMLALVCLTLKRDAVAKFWAVVVLLGLVLALGRYAPFGFYKIVYALPVLNLFRVPARHLMEVEFALAVLAGRGLTAIPQTLNRARRKGWVLVAGVIVIVLTCLAITMGRPANFQLGRSGPVSILRAPELFLPVVIAVLSFVALWLFAKRRRGALVFLLAVVVFDLGLWGQSSGWRAASPKSNFELWGTPATVQFLRSQAGPIPVRTGSVSDRSTAGANPESYRILTQDVAFDPDSPTTPAAPPPSGVAWIPSLQPDVYMMYGIENAAGYDGFGLARYSKLAGDMKVWGDFTDANRTLGNDSRELDLLNVRYLLARSATAAAGSGEPKSAEFPVANMVYGGQSFAAENLTVPSVVAGERLSFQLPPIAADRIALLTNLAWSEAVSDRTVVAHIRLHTDDGRTFNFELRAGEHTSEWAYDRSDIRARIKHKRAPVATSYEVEDPQGKYEAHTYVSSFALPGRAVITGGEITVARIPTAPQLTLSVSRVTLADGERAFPLRSEWLKKESEAKVEEPSVATHGKDAPARWQHVAEADQVAILENTRVLPRAWLASGEFVATDEQELAVIRSGKLPSGALWDPFAQALVESSTGINFPGASLSGDDTRRAEVTVNEPNRVEVKTESASPALLVLSANHYPGWRAFVDGQAVEVMRVNYNQRGVAVPAGNHLVSFVYHPKSVLIGLAISLLTLAGLAWGWWRAR